MKKISKIALFTLLLILFSIVPVKADDSYTTSAVLDKTQVNKGEEFTLVLSAKGIPQDATKVLTAKVDFDDTVLEYSKKSAKGGWTAVVSTDGTSITANAEETEGNDVVALTFKVKETTELTSTVISIKDVKVALEEDEGNKDRIVTGCTAKINIGKTEQKEETSEEPKEDPMPADPVEDKKEETKEETKQETKTTDPTTSQAKSQPNTGLETTILPVVIAVFMIIAIVSYKSYRKINKIV